MNIKQGMIDYRYVATKEFKLFTGNSFITKGGRLVMGRGAALEVRDYYPDIDKYFADSIRGNYNYGLRIDKNTCLGVFQVKNHFRDNANLYLIDYSGSLLKSVAQVFSDTEFHCNFPGIGNGRLEYDNVLKVLQELDLPDNVTFWR